MTFESIDWETIELEEGQRVAEEQRRQQEQQAEEDGS